MIMKNEELSLSNNLFEKFVELFYNYTGISLQDYKKYLVEYRLQRIIGSDKQFRNFEDFYEGLIHDNTGEIRTKFINLLTTNFTYFYREDVHFEFLRNHLCRNTGKESYTRLWSAGCSSGEEAYSMAITCIESMGNAIRKDVKILATDISLDVLRFGHYGMYHYSKIKGGIEDSLLKRYFHFDSEKKTFTVKKEIRDMVNFRYLNLMKEYPFEKKFDAVFLRNVLIYFDNNEKEHILNKIYDYIKDGGFLIIGLSESLVGIRHRYVTLKNSIFQKK